MNEGSVLVYNATINSSATDETPLDNTFSYTQTVVNSFDPNDKTCLEGTRISTYLIGQYAHYMIRLENNGTANAQNIVVKDMMDLSKFDISSLISTIVGVVAILNLSITQLRFFLNNIADFSVFDFAFEPRNDVKVEEGSFLISVFFQFDKTFFHFDEFFFDVAWINRT